METPRVGDSIVVSDGSNYEGLRLYTCTKAMVQYFEVRRHDVSLKFNLGGVGRSVGRYYRRGSDGTTYRPMWAAVYNPEEHREKLRFTRLRDFAGNELIRLAERVNRGGKEAADLDMLEALEKAYFERKERKTA